MPAPSKLPFPRRIWTPSNTRFFRPIRIHIPNGILSSSAVSVGLTIVTAIQTDRPTDHATPSVTIGRIYVHSTAMRPKHASAFRSYRSTGRFWKRKRNFNEKRRKQSDLATPWFPFAVRPRRDQRTSCRDSPALPQCRDSPTCINMTTCININASISVTVHLRSYSYQVLTDIILPIRSGNSTRCRVPFTSTKKSLHY